MMIRNEKTTIEMEYSPFQGTNSAVFEKYDNASSLFNEDRRNWQGTIVCPICEITYLEENKEDRSYSVANVVFG